MVRVQQGEPKGLPQIVNFAAGPFCVFGKYATVIEFIMIESTNQEVLYDKV